jgi:hypothetical protein
MSDVTESIGLPNYDAALAALDVTIIEAQAALASADLTLEECIAIVGTFQNAECGFAPIRRRADRRGSRLFRKLAREGRLPWVEQP